MQVLRTDSRGNLMASRLSCKPLIQRKWDLMFSKAEPINIWPYIFNGVFCTLLFSRAPCWLVYFIMMMLYLVFCSWFYVEQFQPVLTYFMMIGWWHFIKDCFWVPLHDWKMSNWSISLVVFVLFMRI